MTNGTVNLQDWMVDKIDFDEVNCNQYVHTYQVEVRSDGFVIKIDARPSWGGTVDLTSWSTNEVRSYVSVATHLDSWSTFTNPNTPSNKVANLAEYLTQIINEDYYNRFCDSFPIDEVAEDVYGVIAEALEVNNDAFESSGESRFQGVIDVDEALSQISVIVGDIENAPVIDSDNLLEWRNEYSVGDGVDYEDWVNEEVVDKD